MKDEYTGGPAFPAAHFDLADHEHGMTLRDYFAAKVMQTMEWDFYDEGALNDAQAMREAKRCYRIADAMLKAREA